MTSSKPAIFLVTGAVTAAGMFFALFKNGYFHQAPLVFEPPYSEVNADGDPILAVFEGRTPCHVENCEKLKVGLVLYQHRKTQSPTTYWLGIIGASGNDRIVTQGTWRISARRKRVSGRGRVGARLEYPSGSPVLLARKRKYLASVRPEHEPQGRKRSLGIYVEQICRAIRAKTIQPMTLPVLPAACDPFDRIAPITHHGFYVLVLLMAATGFATAIKSFGSGRVASSPGITSGAPRSRLLCFPRRFCRRSGRVGDG